MATTCKNPCFILSEGFTISTLMKSLEKKAKCELPKDVECCFEQILEEAPYKTTAIQQLAYHLTNHSSKMNKTC